MEKGSEDSKLVHADLNEQGAQHDGFAGMLCSRQPWRAAGDVKMLHGRL